MRDPVKDKEIADHMAQVEARGKAEQLAKENEANPRPADANA